MDRPIPKVVTLFDYEDCVQYINHLHNIDIDNMVIGGKSYSFADTLHGSLDESTFKLGYWMADGDEYIRRIIKLFHDEFGEDATYSVEGCY